MRFHDVINGLFFVLLGLTVILLARQFPQMPGQSIGPGTFPTIIGSGMIIGGAIIAFMALRTIPLNHAVILASGWKRMTAAASVIFCVFGTLLFGIFFESIGFPVGALVLCVGLYLLNGIKKPTLLIMATVFVFAVTVIMTKFLYVPLPMGVFS